MASSARISATLIQPLPDLLSLSAWPRQNTYIHELSRILQFRLDPGTAIDLAIYFDKMPPKSNNVNWVVADPEDPKVSVKKLKT